VFNELHDWGAQPDEQPRKVRSICALSIGGPSPLGSPSAPPHTLLACPSASLSDGRTLRARAPLCLRNLRSSRQDSGRKLAAQKAHRKRAAHRQSALFSTVFTLLCAAFTLLCAPYSAKFTLHTVHCAPRQTCWRPELRMRLLIVFAPRPQASRLHAAHLCAFCSSSGSKLAGDFRPPASVQLERVAERDS